MNFLMCTSDKKLGSERMSVNILCNNYGLHNIINEYFLEKAFRVLKTNEQRAFGEYRTQRLMLAAWDALQTGVPL